MAVRMLIEILTVCVQFYGIPDEAIGSQVDHRCYSQYISLCIVLRKYYFGESRLLLHVDGDWTFMAVNVGESRQRKNQDRLRHSLAKQWLMQMSDLENVLDPSRIFLTQNDDKTGVGGGLSGCWDVGGCPIGHREGPNEP
eukprot:scaffold2090_cov103-Cylindrotheca_fusiformis.AAC.9